MFLSVGLKKLVTDYWSHYNVRLESGSINHFSKDREALHTL